jgi:hypothetical protein
MDPKATNGGGVTETNVVPSSSSFFDSFSETATAACARCICIRPDSELSAPRLLLLLLLQVEDRMGRQDRQKGWQVRRANSFADFLQS